MTLRLDDYLTRNFQTKFVRERETYSRILQFPKAILLKLGISVEEMNFSATPYHYHEKTDELFKFKNEGTVILEGVEFSVNKGDVLYVPKNMKHKLIPLHFYEYVKEYGMCNNQLETLHISVPFFDPSDEIIVEL